jgi:hypothetical protein
MWLQSLALAPKSKVHIRGLVCILWEFAMWRGDVLRASPMPQCKQAFTPGKPKV